SIEADNRNATGLPKDIHDVRNGMELRMQPNATLLEKYAESSYIPEDFDDADNGPTLTIPYTYSVYFREEERLEWQNRWDLYFVNEEDSSKIHWLAIVNSLIICGVLTAVVAVIGTRTIQCSQ
ncbi:hypothetical protein LTR16_012342, partial [Cryomyces antarcticus]